MQEGRASKCLLSKHSGRATFLNEVLWKEQSSGCQLRMILYPLHHPQHGAFAKVWRYFWLSQLERMLLSSSRSRSGWLLRHLTIHRKSPTTIPVWKCQYGQGWETLEQRNRRKTLTQDWKTLIGDHAEQSLGTIHHPLLRFVEQEDLSRWRSTPSGNGIFTNRRNRIVEMPPLFSNTYTHQPVVHMDALG